MWLFLLTQRRTGVLLSVGSFVATYWLLDRVNSSSKNGADGFHGDSSGSLSINRGYILSLIGPTGVSTLAGCCTYAFFSAFRKRYLSKSYEVGDQRPDWMKARYALRRLASPSWSDAIEKIYGLLDCIQNEQFKRNGTRIHQVDMLSIALYSRAMQDEICRKRLCSQGSFLDWKTAGNVIPLKKSWKEVNLDGGNKPSKGELIHLSMARYYICHAVASYGYLFCAALNLLAKESVAKRFLSDQNPDELCFLEMTQNSPEAMEFALVSSESDIKHPSFYMVVDHKSKAIVLAIRGTSRISDILTNLDFSLSKFPGQDFLVHSGALKAAQRIFDKVNQKFRDLIGKYPAYQLVLCGHSLGGSCAVLTSMLLAANLRTSEGSRIYCFSYGGLPMIAAVASKQRLSRRFVRNSIEFVNIFNSCDIVPRLSPWSGYRLLNRLDRIGCHVLEGYGSRREMLKFLYGNVFSIDEKTRELLCTAINLEPTALPDVKVGVTHGETSIGSEETVFWRLFHPEGQVFHICSQNPSRLLIAKNADLAPADIELDGGRFFTNHIPNNYKSTLDSILIKILDDESSVKNTEAISGENIQVR